MKLRKGAGRLVTVHLAGSDYLTGLGLAQLLGEASYISITGVSFSGVDAVEQVALQEPDIILLDGAIQDSDVLETTAALHDAAPGSKIVILSAEPASSPHRNDLLHDLFTAGAACQLTRDTTLEDLASALRIVHRGGLTTAVAPRCSHSVDAAPAATRKIAATLKALNARDRSIVEAVAGGQTNAEISARMHLSESTVKARVAEIMRRTGMTNRVQIAVAAVQAGVHAAGGRSTSEASPTVAGVPGPHLRASERRRAVSPQSFLGALSSADSPFSAN